MAEMTRKQVYIESRQDALLKRISQESGLSEAELIRKGIDRILEIGAPPARDLTAWRAERQFIRQRMKRGGAKGKRTWKREELYEP